MKSDPVIDFFLLLAVMALMLLIVGTAHGATSAPKHTNDFGAIIEYTNPLVYNFGKITEASMVRTQKHSAVNLRFQPFGTFELYTEQVLLCGPPSDELVERGGKGPVVLAYKRQAHEAVDGIACHDLEGVFSVGAQ